VTPWYRTITREQWRVLIAAKLGWMLDAMDFMIYAMAVGRLKTYFGFDDATAGMLGTVTLAMSAIGGLIFGVVADRLGRTRALMGTICSGASSRSCFRRRCVRRGRGRAITRGVWLVRSRRT